VGTKGQPEGLAVKGKTGKPWVAGTDRKTWNAAGQNNSNPTPYAASVANGEWELLLVNSSHYCFSTASLILYSVIASSPVLPCKTGDEAISFYYCFNLLSLTSILNLCHFQD
jgi:hypothetical protein